MRLTNGAPPILRGVRIAELPKQKQVFRFAQDDNSVLTMTLGGPPRASREAIREARQKTGVAVAAITLWELAWLAETGRIQVVGSVESFVRDAVSRVILKPLTAEIAVTSRCKLRHCF